MVLLPVEGPPANPQAVPAIERFLLGHHREVVDCAAEPTFTALRVRVGGQALNTSGAKGRKRLLATVAYDPPVSVVHRDRPAGINLTWALARGDVSEAEVQATIAAEDRQGFAVVASAESLDYDATPASHDGSINPRV